MKLKVVVHQFEKENHYYASLRLASRASLRTPNATI